MMFVVRRKSIVAVVMAVIMLIAGCMTLRGSGAAQVFFVQETAAKRELPIYSVGTQTKQVALTFDAAWGAEDTQNIIDILAKYNVKATFFLVGIWVEKYPDAVNMLRDAGHEIGSHSSKHKFMSKMSQAEVVNDLTESMSKITQVSGVVPKVFRPPYGDYNNTLIKTCRSVGMTPIQWSIDSLDWKGLSAAEMLARIKDKLHEGGIILCHNGSEHIVEALPGIIEYISSQGYQFAKVSDMLYQQDYYIDNNGVQRLNGQSAAKE